MRDGTVNKAVGDGQAANDVVLLRFFFISEFVTKLACPDDKIPIGDFNTQGTLVECIPNGFRKPVIPGPADFFLVRVAEILARFRLHSRNWKGVTLYKRETDLRDSPLESLASMSIKSFTFSPLVRRFLAILRPTNEEENGDENNDENVSRFVVVAVRPKNPDGGIPNEEFKNSKESLNSKLPLRLFLNLN